ncbi:MAG: hypothetical protein WA144_15520 [Candidatus Methanoperedens sp.]
MATIREITISSIGEPAHVKLEKNSKGYNYEIGLYSENLDGCIGEIMAARERIEKELKTTQEPIA